MRNTKPSPKSAKELKCGRFCVAAQCPLVFFIVAEKVSIASVRSRRASMYLAFAFGPAIASGLAVWSSSAILRNSFRASMTLVKALPLPVVGICPPRTDLCTPPKGYKETTVEAGQ